MARLCELPGLKPLAGFGDRSLPPPVAETGRRSVGNRKECRLRHDYASFPEGCKPLPISFGVCPKGAREMMFYRSPSAARTRSGLAALHQVSGCCGFFLR